MVFGNKQLEELHAEILAMKDGLERQEHAIQQLVATSEQRHADTHKALSKLAEKQQLALTDFQEHIDSILALNLRYEQGIASLKKVKSDLSDLMYESALKDTTVAVERLLQDIKAQLNGVGDVLTQVTTVRDSLSGLRSEVDRFSRMGSSIKEIDAQLVNYVREVTQQDKAKLDLMRQIDKLQTQISRMRRQ